MKEKKLIGYETNLQTTGKHYAKNDIGFGMVLYHMSLIDSIVKGFEGHLVAKISNEFQ